MKQKTMMMTLGLVTLAMSFESFAAAGATGTRSRKIRNDNTSVSLPVVAAQANSRTLAQVSHSATVGTPRQARNDTPVAATLTAPSGSSATPSNVRVVTTRPVTAPTGSLGNLLTAPPSTANLQTFAPGPGVTKDEDGKLKCRKSWFQKQSSTTTVVNGVPTPSTTLSCEPGAAYNKDPILYDSCDDEPAKNRNNKEMPMCASAWENSEMNTCGKKAKEAREAYNKFSQACADAGIAGVKTCMDEAKACVTASEDEGTSAKGDFDNDFWKSIGMANNNKPFNDKASRVTKCSVYGLKDYETEKRERTRTLRDAQKEMAELQKDMAKDKKELAEKKKEIQTEFVKMQAEMRKDMTEEQKAQAEAGMQAQKDMMDVDNAKAELRAANISARSEQAKITGERALALAELSDAMIHTRCMAELEKVIAEMKVGMASGAQNYLNNFAERKRRVQSVKALCYAKLEATRAATAKDYRAQLDAVENRVAGNNERIQSLEAQKVSIGNNQKEAVTRAATAQTAANNELYQKMQASQMQMQELAASAQQSEMAANQNILQAQQRMNETLSDIGNLGKRPKGLKQPTEAASQFRNFANLVKAMETDPGCETEVGKLSKIVTDASLKDYYDNDLNTDSDSDEEEATR